MPTRRDARSNKVTIFDVAARAGVSIKTVSRVVNKESNVRAQTRERVLDAVRALHYRPNAAARALSGNRSRVVGLVYENAQEFSYTQHVLNGALGACEARDYALLLCPTGLPNPDIVDRVRDFAAEGRVEGVVLPAPLGDLAEVRALLSELSIPFAAITPKEPSPEEINISCRDRDATFGLTEYLIGQGHRAIGFITGHPDHAASGERYAGYRDALRDHGVPFAEDLVRQGYFDFESGKRAAGALLELTPAPSAIIASNDDMAAGVLFEARERGTSVPGDLSIVGFDDTRIASRVWPPLTTARQPIARMAETATRLLIDRLDGEPARSPEQSFECELVIRESTARAR
ncbi:MAG: LacI family DNA-binding transcriptional regulator [Gammaproteobacteria bacterium]|nr:LacI family DNA-binding transcriptional regulator [Gammaproteobacteria bacterium]